MFLDYFALGLLFFVGLVIFYGIIAIHDIPYEIAKHRNHPHQDAIHVSGWVSLFTLHALWPFLWIWATIYRPDRGWGFSDIQKKEEADIAALRTELSELKSRIDQIDQTNRTAQLDQAEQIDRADQADQIDLAERADHIDQSKQQG